jgi:hypothetical protein
MSRLTNKQMMQLMAFADGELEGAEKDEIAALIEKDRDASDLLAEMGHLGDAVRVIEPRALPSLDSFDIADAVMAKLDAKSEAPAKNADEDKLRVVSLEAAREKRRRVGVFVGTAIALAAGIALVVRTHPNEEPQATSGLAVKSIDSIAVPSPKSPPASSEASQQVANAAAEPSGVEVNVADSPQTGVSVFYLPGANATGASAVVWIDDSQGGKN